MKPPSEAHRAVPIASKPTDSRLVRRLLSNYIFQTLVWGLRLFDQLLLIPLYIVAWGTDLYKDWLIIFALGMFFNSFNFGIDDYFGNLFLRSVATQNKAALQRQVRVGLFVSFAIALGMLILFCAMLVTLPVRHALGLSTMHNRTAIFCLVVLTFPVCVWYARETVHGLYRAFGDYSRGECIYAILSGAQILSAAVLLALRQPPEMVALCYGVLPLIYCIVTAIDVHLRYPVIAFGIAVPTRAEWAETMRKSLLYFTTSLSTIITQQVVLLGFGFLNAGVTVIMQYNVLRVFAGLTRQVGSQSFAVVSGIEMARQYAANERNACRKLYSHAGRVVSILVGVLSGLSIPLSDPFVSLWTHNAVSGNATMITFFLAGIILSAPGRASLMLLRYTNHAYPIAVANVVQSVGGVLFALILYPSFGGLGVVAAFAAAEVLGVGLYPATVVSSVFGFGATKHMFYNMLFAACAFALSFGVAAPLFYGYSIDVHVLVGKVLVWAVVIAPPSLIVILPSQQRVRLVAAARRLISLAVSR